jgi:hypothetical protein
MKKRWRLLGACGLYCGACYHHHAALPEGQHLLEEAARQGRTLEGFSCQGCRSDVLYVHPGCARCQIRACSDERGIEHCGLCHEFPCNRLRAFQSDGRAHHLDVVANLAELTSFLGSSSKVCVAFVPVSRSGQDVTTAGLVDTPVP